MQVVYLDSLFLLNFIINYLLLLASGKICGTPFNRWRIAIGATFGGLYSVSVWLPNLEFLNFWIMKIIVGILIVLISYINVAKSRLVRLTIVFILVSFSLGGAVYAISLLIFGTADMYLSIDFNTLLLTSGISYAILCLVFKKSARHTGNELYDIEIKYHNKTVTFKALKDSGHTLTDPLTGIPILIVDAKIIKNILDISQDMLDNPTYAVLNLTEYGHSLRLVPFRTIGVNCDFMLAFRPDFLTINKKQEEKMLIGISPTAISDSGVYNALIG